MSIKIDPFSFLDNQIDRAFAEIQQDRAAGYVVPERRVCGFSTNNTESQKERAERATFIAKKDIIGAPRAMKFLPSPFPKTDTDFPPEEVEYFIKKFGEYFKTILKRAQSDAEKLAKAVAITKEGKHVILQQATASCVPTSVAMLVLDHGGTPNYASIQKTHIADTDRTIQWFADAGFATKKTELSSRTMETLSTCLNEYGPGILRVYDAQGIYGHTIVLDDISLESGTATIRDPFHGWQIDIELSALEKICGSSFIQITGNTASTP